MRALIVSVALLAATGAHAEGFAVHDLSTVAVEINAALGAGFSNQADSKRVTLSCDDCVGKPMVDIRIGRQDDGTEQRVRSGQTTIARLEELCQQKSPSCKLFKLEVEPAVGWITTYPAGAMAASTAVILRDGDLLMIRSVAADTDAARSNAEKAVKAMRQKVIGK